MITTRIRRRLALLLGLLFVSAALTALPVVNLPGHPAQAAQAAVAAGDVVLEQSGNVRQYHSSDSSISTIVSSASMPDVSPDGSKIVFVAQRAPNYDLDLYVANSDGSGETQITQRIASEDNLGSTPVGYTVYRPQWSADGQSIVFTKYSNATGLWKIKTVPAIGGGSSTVLSQSSPSVNNATWSPDGARIAYDVTESGLSQIRIVDSDGSNDHRITSSLGSYNDQQPAFSPDGSRIYVSSNEAYSGAGNGFGITYFAYTGTGGSFSTTSVTRASSSVTTESSYKSDLYPRPSADGSTIYFQTSGNGSASWDAANVSSSGGTVTLVTSVAWNAAIAYPSPVAAAWSIKKMAVLGDSFSAGEGNPSFIYPSDTNGCHRSAAAYAEVLGNRPVGLQLSADGFVACSGATTNDLINGMNGEDSQLDAIISEDDIVILTIGGNNVGFPTYAKRCVIGGCEENSTPYNAIEASINNDLPDDLDDLFSELSTYTGTKRVLVMGYPDLVVPSGSGCAGMDPDDQAAASAVHDDLNAAIEAAVSRADDQFEYVDPGSWGSPFAGHEMCTTNPYFHEINWVDTYSGVTFLNVNYSYHPNEEGQAAYASLVANYLAANPS